MRNIDLTSISFNKLQIFIVAAESKSFSIAAEKMNITHSTISKNIASLELELNLILFLKNSTGISLTPAGKFLHEKCTELFTFFSNAIERAHEIQTGKMISLSIGYIESALSIESKNIIKSFHDYFPNVDISLHRLSITDLCREFNDHRLDIVFISNLNMPLLDSKDVKCCIAQKCKTTLFFPDTHRFNEMDKITIQDLQQENFIIISNESLPGYTNLIYSLCEGYGFKPSISKVSPNGETSFLYVSMGYGIILGIDNMDTLTYPNIKKYILEEKIGDIILAWHDDLSKPLVRKFVELFKK